MSEKEGVSSQEIHIEPKSSRNELIRRALSEGKIPMLPFELHQLQAELLGHISAQDELSRLLGEAMQTTSETWHDNAQADAVTMQSGILTQQANAVLEAMKRRLVISYNQDDFDKVSIGAIVQARIGNSSQRLFVTGRMRTLPLEVATYIGDETNVVNIQSPIGAAIFDQPVGTTTSYHVGSREFHVYIEDVSYPDIAAVAQE